MAVVANGVDFAAHHFFHGNGEQAVVQQQHIARLHIVGQFAVIQPHALACALAFQRSIKQQFFARFHLDAAAGDFGHADFRPLQIRHNRHFQAGLPRRFAHDAGIFFVKLGRAVAEIKTHHMHAADADHIAQQIHVVAARPQRCHDFGVVADAR